MVFTYVGAYIVAFLFLAVVLWLLIDFVQRYVYDETTANMLPRAAGAGAILGLLVVVFPADWDYLLSLSSLLVHAPAWVLVFRFIFLVDIGISLLVGLGGGALILPLVTMTNHSIFPSLAAQ